MDFFSVGYLALWLLRCQQNVNKIFSNFFLTEKMRNELLLPQHYRFSGLLYINRPFVGDSRITWGNFFYFEMNYKYSSSQICAFIKYYEPMFSSQTIDEEYEADKQNRLRSAIAAANESEVEEIEDNPELASDAFAAYFADGYNPKTGDVSEGDILSNIVYCAELGLAIEKPKNGFTMQQLWEVIPSS